MGPPRTHQPPRGQRAHCHGGRALLPPPRHRPAVHRRRGARQPASGRPYARRQHLDPTARQAPVLFAGKDLQTQAVGSAARRAARVVFCRLVPRHQRRRSARLQRSPPRAVPQRGLLRHQRLRHSRRRGHLLQHDPRLPEPAPRGHAHRPAQRSNRVQSSAKRPTSHRSAATRTRPHGRQRLSRPADAPGIRRPPHRRPH